MPSIGTINVEGVNVDLYIPRKCHASNTLITAFDHGSVQINIGDIDANGVYTGSTKSFCLAGFIRNNCDSDHALNRLCISGGIIRPRTAKPKVKKVKVAAKPAAKPAAKGKAAPKAAAKDNKKDNKKPAAKDNKKDAKKPAAKDNKKPAAKTAAPKDVKKAAPKPAKK